MFLTDCHLYTHKLYDHHKSACHTGHPKEIALLKVHQDIVEALALVLLDLSAVCDAIADGIIQKRLQYSFTVT